jgi:CheY-like chemotaxis protein
MTKILTVDNEAKMQSMISSALGGKYSVIQASNGKEALDLFKQHCPDVVITDFSMPQMSGFQLVRNIREFDNLVKIIATSPLFSRPEDADLMRRSGADVCLAKPVDINGLETIISVLLGH